MSVALADWLTLTKHEYIRRFIADRGCSVKFIAGPHALVADAEDGISAIASERLLPIIRVDAAETRLHMIQDIFFAIAREVDWARAAQRWVEGVFRVNQLEWPRPGEAVPLREVAEFNRIDPTMLRVQVLRWMNQHLMNERELAQDFRSAMSNLCMRRLEPEDAETVAPVIEWLHGDLRTIGSVRDVPISAKINRHNGRAMLRSLCHWLRLTNSRGLVVILDLRAVSRPQSGLEKHYSPAAVFDAFEVLRQVIDDAESYEGLFLLVTTDEHFTGDDFKRSVAAYPALKERIWPDVHPQGHENPLAPLLTLAPFGTAPPLPEAAGARNDMPYLPARVAIEALRMGVPNKTAIKLLGTSEEAFQNRFADRLREARNRSSGAIEGDVIAGTFGSGKSHLLGYLGQQALDQDFVVSQVAISKEAALFDPERVYAAAIRNAVVPRANDDAIGIALQRLNPTAQAFTELEFWASSEEAGLSHIFAALLHLWPRNTLANEDRIAIVRFLSGAKLSVTKVKQWLRNAGGAGLVKLFNLKTVKSSELALQRIRFAPALFRAAGYSGWCVLFDEVELILRYTPLQRAKSYAELARWLGFDKQEAVPGVIGVAGVTSNFVETMLDTKRDDEKLPLLLEAKGLDRQAALARTTMELVARKQHFLAAPTQDTVQSCRERVRALYAASYGNAPSTNIPPGTSTTMRHHIKSWITAWDIERLYGRADEIEIEEAPKDNYEEDRTLEQAPPEEVDLDLA